MRLTFAPIVLSFKPKLEFSSFSEAASAASILSIQTRNMVKVVEDTQYGLPRVLQIYRSGRPTLDVTPPAVVKALIDAELAMPRQKTRRAPSRPLQYQRKPGSSSA